jgi:hypothetical protein
MVRSMPVEVEVLVDGIMRIKVSGGGAAVCSIALKAAQATRARDHSFAFVTRAPGVIQCEQRAAFRATPERLREIAEQAVARGRRAVVWALRAAGYQVLALPPVTMRVDGSSRIVFSGGGDNALAVALKAAYVTRLWGDKRFQFVADGPAAIRCEPVEAMKTPPSRLRRTLAPIVARGRLAAARALRMAGYPVREPGIVKVRVDRSSRIVVSGGGADARSIALTAAQATRARAPSSTFVSRRPGVIEYEDRAAYRATPLQLQRMLEVAVERGRKAVVKALREAGFEAE